MCAGIRREAGTGGRDAIGELGVVPAFMYVDRVDPLMCSLHDAMKPRRVCMQGVTSMLHLNLNSIGSKKHPQVVHDKSVT